MCTGCPVGRRGSAGAATPRAAWRPNGGGGIGALVFAEVDAGDWSLLGTSRLGEGLWGGPLRRRQVNAGCGGYISLFFRVFLRVLSCQRPFLV